MPFGSEKLLPSHKVIMIELIEMYKNMSFLWDKSHPSYQNRLLRMHGYKKMLEKYREIDEEITLPILKGKLDNMRTSYIRELKKVRASKGIASCPKSVYSPVLWYYELFSFLEDHVLKKRRVIQRSNREARNGTDFLYHECDDEGSESTTEYDHMPVEYLEESDEDNSECSEVPLKRHKIMLDPKGPTQAGLAPCVQNEHWEVIGKALGLQLGHTEPRQAAIAQKLISDVLFYAKLGKLAEETTICLI